MLFAFVYAQKRGDKVLRDKLKDYARYLVLSEENFDRNWVFCYHALTPRELSKRGDWSAIRKAGVSFVDWSKLEPVKVDAPKAKLTEMFEALSDDHGEDDPAEMATNDL